MRCWQCGKDIEQSANYCPSCGAYVKRTEPISERGKALRLLYDQYGAKELLTNTIFLSNAYYESCPDDHHFIKQLDIAFEADIGNMYLEQIKNVGKPNSQFNRKIENILSEEAGFTKKVSHDIMVALDEMIGWPAYKKHPIKRQKNAKQMKKKSQLKIEDHFKNSRNSVSKMPLYIMCLSVLLTITLIVLTWTVIGSDERNIIRLCIAVLNIILASLFVLMLRRQKQKKASFSKIEFFSILLFNLALIIFAILEWAGIDAFGHYYYTWRWDDSYYTARVFRHVQTFIFMIVSGVAWIVITLLKGTTKKTELQESIQN